MTAEGRIMASREQATYVAKELRRGVMPLALKLSLRQAQWPEPLIKALMGHAYDGIIPPDAVDYKAIHAARICQLAETHPDIRQVHTSKAQVFTWSGFLEPDVCDQIIALTEQLWRDSTVADPFADPKVRTSRSADIGSLGDPLIMTVDQSMAEALGFHWSYSDSAQSQRYEFGQEYKAHHDYFQPGTREHKVECQNLGQRTWTFMVYLSDVEEGGGTRFRKLDKMFMPEKGSAVIWNNLNPDGTVNPWTLHHGMKVRKGTKYIITKWFRERGWGPMLLSERKPPPQVPAP